MQEMQQCFQWVVAHGFVHYVRMNGFSLYVVQLEGSSINHFNLRKKV